MCGRGQTASFAQTLKELQTLDSYSKKILQERYIRILINFQYRCWFYAFLFHSTRFIMTVGSLIVPALLSIQYTDSKPISSVDSEDFSYMIYWTTWVISLLVTTSNGISTLFKIEKKYYFLHATLEQLRSEGWQYLELSGKYSGFYTPNEKVTHSNQFLYFCHWIEKLKMKQVQEEYLKLTDATGHMSNSGKQTTTAGNSGETQQAATENGEHSQITHEKLQELLPNFLMDSLLPPTPYNIRLQQLLQRMGLQEKPSNAVIDGGGGKSQKPKKSEVPVRSDVQSDAAPKESFLQQTSAQVPKEESVIRVGAEIPTEQMEQRQEVPKNP